MFCQQSTSHFIEIIPLQSTHTILAFWLQVSVTMNSPSSATESGSLYPTNSNNVDTNAALQDIKTMLQEIMSKVDLLAASTQPPQQSSEPTDPRLFRSQSPEEEESLFVSDLPEGSLVEESDNPETGSSIAGRPSPGTVTVSSTETEVIIC
jgi:hypothetical protein